MTLKIEAEVHGALRTLRLIGHLNAGNLPELALLLGDGSLPSVLDLKDISMVDVDAVRFLALCRRRGVRLRNASPYLERWITEERNSAS